ncbi:helix-turn-helix domain-containing protein [Actinomadura sp. LD22]|uniref:Helix-turn-helix domain-containing protein n=1 Tax=Actinomadura physcomitrii TaxID=2650748 RepID=A0A6I4MMD2_9ACTN|nr:helix-turn-helix transcriptional regulator [Actinomadura physcomitrii]MWA04721.1 helix-turn-helix domain-containing protein [Actinomadura physcomitrii]
MPETFDMAKDEQDPDPDALRVHFGLELRRLRNRAGLSMNQLAQALGCTPQWICQLEHAEKPPSEQTALDLDTYFKTDGYDENDGSFHRLHTAIRRVGQRRALRPSFENYCLREPKAIGVRCLAAQLVPGLLQTEDYARGIMDRSQTAENLDACVAVRLERQTMFHRAKPPEASFVLDESALRRPVGGAKAMADQIDHLIDMARLPNVQILIMPFERLTLAALAGGFILLSFAKEPDLVYAESGSLSFMTERKDVTFRMGVHFLTTAGEALNQGESIAFMSRVREEYL